MIDQNEYPVSYNLPEDDGIDVRRYISLFISNWYWFAIALFISISIAYSINKYSPKVYTVSSTLLIKDDQFSANKTSVESVVPGGDIFRNQQNIANEIGILKSFKLNYLVIKELEEFHISYLSIGRRGILEYSLYKSSPLKVIYDSLELQPKGRVLIEIISENTYKLRFEGDEKYEKTLQFGERYKEKGFDITIVKRYPGTKVHSEIGSNDYAFYFTDPVSLANIYKGKLSVSPISEDASIFTLSVSGSDPIQEADYLNKLMEVYVGYGLDNKNRTAELTIAFIDKQLKIIKDSLTLAEDDMENFRRLYNFYDFSKDGTLVKNKLDRLETDKASFSLQLNYYLYLSDYLKKDNPSGEIISPSVMGISDQALLRMVTELSTMVIEKGRLTFNVESDQPLVELINRQIDETKDALRENVRNGIASLNLAIQEIDKKIQEVEKDMGMLPETERELLKIQRQFDLNNTVYTYLLEKRAESDIARASNLPDNTEIDKASIYSSGLVKPKTRLNYMIALILGVFLPMTGIILIDYFNDKVIDKVDVESKTKVPIIGFIGHSEGKKDIPVAEKPGSSLAESFRSVRTAIKYFIKDNQKPVITVSSTISSEGKTFISINLAAILAMLGKKILLVGLDLRKPRINRVFEYTDSRGMSTYLCGQCEYEEVIKPTRIENLFYAPSGPIPPNPSELIDTEYMKIFLDKAKEEFDFIVIDTPPVAIVTDALLLAPYVDLNLFIVRQRYSSRYTLSLIEQLNRDQELKKMAIIINDINLTGYYGYGLRYGYSSGYGYSYGYKYYGKGYYGRYGDKNKTHGYYTEDN